MRALPAMHREVAGGLSGFEEALKSIFYSWPHSDGGDADLLICLSSPRCFFFLISAIDA
jgi:hypothetical protein